MIVHISARRLVVIVEAFHRWNFPALPIRESLTCSMPLLQHLIITAALDAGLPLRDVREAVSHADLRTTTRNDRARVSLDRQAT
jgi:hypothetical protein